MDSIDLIRENLERSERIVLSRIEEMQEHCMVPPTARGGCHTLWILGHLAYIEGLVVQEIALGEPNPLADWTEIFDGAEVSSLREAFPPFVQVLRACRNVRRETLSLIRSLSETDVDAVSARIPAGAEDLFPTIRSCLQYASDHWFMHRGQLADCRRAAGVERMWF